MNLQQRVTKLEHQASVAEPLDALAAMSDDALKVYAQNCEVIVRQTGIQPGEHQAERMATFAPKWLAALAERQRRGWTEADLEDAELESHIEALDAIHRVLALKGA